MTEGEDIDFDVVKEDWNIYKFADGGILKVRLILGKIFKTGRYNPAGEPIYSFGIQTLAAITTPAEMKGSPTTPPPSIEELEKSATEEVDFTSIKEEWNQYRINDGSTVQIKLSVTKVLKTNKFDQLGYPYYLNKSETLTRINVPPELWKKT
jgi:hypothetical protein